MQLLSHNALITHLSHNALITRRSHNALDTRLCDIAPVTQPSNSALPTELSYYPIVLSR